MIRYWTTTSSFVQPWYLRNTIWCGRSCNRTLTIAPSRQVTTDSDHRSSPHGGPMEFRSKPRTCCGAQQRPLGTRAARHDDEELKGISSGRRGMFNVFLTSYVPSATTVAQARSVGAHEHEKKQSTTTMIGEQRVYKATAVYVRYSCVLSTTAIGVASRTTREKQGTSAGNLGFTKRTVVSVLCSVFYQRLPWRWLNPEAHPSHEKKQGTTEGNPGSRNVDFLCFVFYQRQP